ncbi:MAG: SMP-30/gluconolactonase/LRE family protein [Armatimonadetes bacterium]|nr:SMP-30/gluconolactonase/LRE family protein [Armatimonadota bacterium]
MVGRLVLLLLAVAATYAQAATVLAPGAELKRLYADAAFTEGPTCDAQGNVFFSDQPNDRILRCSTAGDVTVWRQGCGRANGMCFAPDGALWTCADEKNEAWRIAPDGTVEVLFRAFAEKLLNGPNDLWCAPNGGCYFTDPFYKRAWWQRGGQEQPCQGVYYLTPDRQTIVRVADDLQSPNGLIGTADGKTLYVADLGAGKTYRYAIAADGSLKDKALFCGLGSDGMTIDDEGNVYLTGKGVLVYDSTGRQIETISVPQGWTANVCFGGPERRSLYITAGKCLYAIATRVRGVGSQ